MAKNKVLADIRSRLGVAENDPGRLAAVNERIASHPRNTIPGRAKMPHEALIEQFQQRSEGRGMTTSRVANNQAVIAEILNRIDGVEIELCVSTDVLAMGLPFESESRIKLVKWTPKSSLGTTLTTCYGGVAETGSLAVISSKSNPLSQSFLGDQHIVILQTKDIVGAYEEVWQRVREEGGMPRDLTLVSGPSSTGDIEMRMEYGAHGPRGLHVIIVGEPLESYEPLG